MLFLSDYQRVKMFNKSKKSLYAFFDPFKKLICKLICFNIFSQTLMMLKIIAAYEVRNNNLLNK